MSMRRPVPLVLLVLPALPVLAALAGCQARDERSEHSYFPLQPGARWVYAVHTETDGAASRQRQTISVLDERVYGGKPLFIRRSETPGNIGIEYWLREQPDGIMRIAQRLDLQEQASLDETPRTVLKLPLTVGASWRAPTVAYTVMRKNDFPRELKYGRGMLMTYTVEALDETLTVPAGTFSRCARVAGHAEMTLFSDPVRGFSKVPLTTTEWYCRGVGLARLERVEKLATAFYSGGKVTMELLEYSPR
jgi:hypothetical protein